MTDRQERIEKHMKLEKEQLARRLVLREDDVQRLKQELDRMASVEADLRNRLYMYKSENGTLMRKLRLKDAPPIRMMIEYRKRELEFERDGTEPAEVDLGVVVEPFFLREWSIKSDDDDFYVGGYAIVGVGDSFDEVEIHQVLSYTMPDGARHVIDDDEEETSK